MGFHDKSTTPSMYKQVFSNHNISYHLVNFRFVDRQILILQTTIW